MHGIISDECMQQVHTDDGGLFYCERGGDVSADVGFDLTSAANHVMRQRKVFFIKIGEERA